MKFMKAWRGQAKFYQLKSGTTKQRIRNLWDVVKSKHRVKGVHTIILILQWKSIDMIVMSHVGYQYVGLWQISGLSALGTTVDRTTRSALRNWCVIYLYSSVVPNHAITTTIQCLWSKEWFQNIEPTAKTEMDAWMNEIPHRYSRRQPFQICCSKDVPIRLKQDTTARSSVTSLIV